MWSSLRTRLFASYLAILMTLLLLVGVILLAFLAARPVSTEGVTTELAATLLDLRIAEADWSGAARPGAGGGQALSEAALALLDDEAASRDVRILLVSAGGVIRYDSAGALTRGVAVAGVNFAPLITPRRATITAVFEGAFAAPDEGEWIFVAQPLRGLGGMHGQGQTYLMVAAPKPRHTLRELFNAFGASFFRPMLQAGAIGFIIALALAVLMADSIARPLGAISRAARRIAGGDYGQRVPVKGPGEVADLALAFNQMAARVAASQQTQRDFLANVSHDLRTPLTSIQGFSQAIAEGVTSDPASAARAAQIIHDEAGRLNRMVASLLELARIEGGEARRDPLDLGELLRGAVERLGGPAGERGLTLTLDAARDLPRVGGDGDRLAQVFTNLLDNAIEHTPAGGAITVTARAADGGVRVAVRDTGEGIPAADLPRVFERFYQVDKSRQRGRRAGMGLGLAICQQIVEAHGGTLRLESEEGRGTTATVWLPGQKSGD